ncbi:MAG: hypothetical protein OEV31_09610, partial [Gammaproteobacteria bacterium]|nr:hypothetical protein [Gammaproteobacteria bacterium]
MKKQGAHQHRRAPGNGTDNLALGGAQGKSGFLVGASMDVRTWNHLQRTIVGRALVHVQADGDY